MLRREHSTTLCMRLFFSSQWKLFQWCSYNQFFSSFVSVMDRVHQSMENRSLFIWNNSVFEKSPFLIWTYNRVFSLYVELLLWLWLQYGANYQHAEYANTLQQELVFQLWLPLNTLNISSFFVLWCKKTLITFPFCSAFRNGITRPSPPSLNSKRKDL